MREFLNQPGVGIAAVVALFLVGLIVGILVLVRMNRQADKAIEFKLSEKQESFPYPLPEREPGKVRISTADLTTPAPSRYRVRRYTIGEDASNPYRDSR